MCTVLLSPGDNPIAVNKYIIKNDVTGDRVQPYSGHTARMVAVSSLKYCFLHIRGNLDSVVTLMSVCEYVNVNLCKIYIYIYIYKEPT